MRIKRLPAAVLIFIFALTAKLSVAQTSQTDTSSSALTQLDVSVTQTWTDTKLDLRSGEKLQVTATGSGSYANSATFDPGGLTRGWKDMLHQYAVPDAGHGALIARIGSGDGSQPFLIGATKEFVAPVAGRLFLGINESEKDGGTAQGSFHVTITILSQGLMSAAGVLVGGPAETPIPSLTAEILGEVPRRVNDPQGNPGDMVNILIVGTQDQLTQTFAAAGWVQVDRSVESTLAAGLEVTLAKKDYLTMPMSTLFLFNRPQDYGFAHAEPVRVVMSRNHLRAWKSAYLVDGRPLWCIAATHDIGFERDQRNNGLTHKIDPAIDGEREYVNDTLSATGLVMQRTHVTPSNPLTTAKTATGGEFHSDGRILVLVLSTQTTNDTD
jgi:hypothetical protein